MSANWKQRMRQVNSISLAANNSANNAYIGNVKIILSTLSFLYIIRDMRHTSVACSIYLFIPSFGDVL